MKIAICDDDKNMVKTLYDKVVSVMDDNDIKCDIDEFYDGETLVKYCSENKTDAVLIDIDMPKMDGFKAVEELQKKQQDLIIIFISAYENYGCQAYDYQPFWFISKNNLEKIDKVLLKLISKWKYIEKSKEIVYLEYDKFISININELMYFKSDKHYIYGYTYSGETMKFRGTLTGLYEKLKEFDFLYVQQRYIVNCRYVDTFTSQYIILKNKEKIAVTRNSKMINEAQCMYLKYWRKQL